LAPTSTPSAIIQLISHRCHARAYFRSRHMPARDDGCSGRDNGQRNLCCEDSSKGQLCLASSSSTSIYRSPWKIRFDVPSLTAIRSCVFALPRISRRLINQRTELKFNYVDSPYEETLLTSLCLSLSLFLFFFLDETARLTVAPRCIFLFLYKSQREGLKREGERRITPASLPPLLSQLVELSFDFVHRACRWRMLVALGKYLRVLSEDINERQESTNQETIDINKLWLAEGLASYRFACGSMREMAGTKSAIIHISTIPLLLFLRSRPPATAWTRYTPFQTLPLHQKSLDHALYTPENNSANVREMRFILRRDVVNAACVAARSRSD